MQNKPSLEVEAANFITEGFETADKTLAGACEILIEAFSEDNIGWAIMNRLTKAAGYNIMDV